MERRAVRRGRGARGLAAIVLAHSPDIAHLIGRDFEYRRAGERRTQWPTRLAHPDPAAGWGIERVVESPPAGEELANEPGGACSLAAEPPASALLLQPPRQEERVAERLRTLWAAGTPYSVML